MITLFRKILSWLSGSAKNSSTEKSSEGLKESRASWQGDPPTLLYREELDRMDEDQKSFYEYWLSKWKQGQAIDLKGNIDYLRPYISNILSWSEKSQKSRNKLVKELSKLQEAYSHNGTFFGQAGTWIADTYILDDKYEKAITELRKVRDNCGYSVSKKLWSLLHHIENIPIGKDLLAQHSQLTDYGKKNIERVDKELTKLLQNYENKNSISLSHELVEQMMMRPEDKPLQLKLFRSSSWRQETDIDAYKPAESGIRNLLEEEGLRVEAENRIRKKDNLPKIGEGWVSETTLKDIVKELLEPHGYSVEYRSSPDWLERQHLDIFVPDLNLAIEYMGKQHYEPIEHFGGEESFQKQKQNDKKKLEKCRENKIDLIYFKYDKPLERDYIAKKLSKHVSLEVEELLEKAREKKDKEYRSYSDEDVKSSLTSKTEDEKSTLSKKEKKKREKRKQKLKELRKPGLEEAYYHRAKLLRQLGRVKKAEEEYWRAIENDKRKNSFPSPAEIRELAKLYYHTGYQDKAVEVMDEYIKTPNWEEHGGMIKGDEMQKLRKQIASGDFMRLKNKYEEKPTGRKPQ